MGKKYRLLFVMSIISFVLSALCIFAGAAAFCLAKQLEETDLSNYDNAISVFTSFLGLGFYVVMLLAAVLALIAAGVTALLGILGMICCKKQGKCSLICLIAGGLLSLFTAASIAVSILQDSFEFYTVLGPAYLGLYTAGSAIVYIDSKKDREGR